MKKHLGIIFLFLIFCSSNYAFANDFRIEIEAGGVFQSKNKIRIPNSSEGSRFNLADFSEGPFPSYRITGSYLFNKRHMVRAIIAPLQLRSSGYFDREVQFNGQTFSANERTIARYKFNSYRLGYRYVFLDTDSWNILAGATLKIRDAKVQLRQGNKNTRDTDIGFVPLLSALFAYHATDDISLLWDIEGLGASQGRAIDSLIGVRYAVNPTFDITLGYRTLEGGADNDSVYTFSWFHYGVLSLGYSF